MRALYALLTCALLYAFPAIATTPTVAFDWFDYRGDDAAFAQPLPPGHYRNPVLAGFHADPSVVAANGRFYLVNSSFTWFPGVPVFESDDLVHWRQIGNVVARPDTLDFDGLEVSRGIFAPAISVHDGVFYVVTTAVDSGGTFISTATDPAGPWSPPHWLPGVGGIDPSLFFDDDGTLWLVNNDAPAGPPRYEGHRAIWLRQLDRTTLKPLGAARVLLDGGVRPAQQPIWIEGPHLYQREGWYYLSAAEGGTGPQHSQVVLRSRTLQGPYVANPHNPILTQRTLDPARPLPVANAGHADLVQGPDGQWWALFLASRLYQQRHYNTGRETFLLPVTWRDGWPMILPPDRAVPYAAPAPSFMHGAAGQAPNSGNFRWHDDFAQPQLDRAWLMLRTPKQPWADLHSQPGTLRIRPRREGLDGSGNPAFLARRQQHLRFEARSALQLPPAGVAAGLAAFQNGRHWYFLGVRRDGAAMQLFLEQRAGDAPARVLVRRTLPASAALQLKIAGDGGDYGFGFDAGDGWQWLADHQDGRILSTDVAGGFVGTMLGPFARDERHP